VRKLIGNKSGYILHGVERLIIHSIADDQMSRDSRVLVWRVLAWMGMDAYEYGL
jgi:hypothetical protein